MASTHRYLLLAVLLGSAACVDQPGALVCPTGIVCPDGTQCAAAQPVCIVNSCGNGRVDTGETCDDGNILSGDGCSPTCGNESCGNGLIEPGERCDDGNTASGDGCSADCLSLETCGNGIKDEKSGGDTAEGCDDGNTEPGDGCRADCKAIEFCGNGLVDPNEVCDDGDPLGGPCSPDCQSGIGCGNGFLDVDLGEQCDDGNTDDNDDCRFPSCKHAVCGDGVVNTLGVRLEACDGGSTGTPVETAECNIDCTLSTCGDGKVNQTDDRDGSKEECDNGLMADSATCDDDCTIPVCGDGHTNAQTSPAEQCDPGTVGADIATCDSDCTTPACGDDHVNKSFTPAGAPAPEGCDDGGTAAGDGCSGVCQIESCGNGVTEAVNGEECDDGNADDLDACRNNCQMPRCGDGVESASEVCDEGMDTATCDIDCSAPMCGDGHVNKQFTPAGASGPEQCEDGNSNNGDGCSSTCRLEPFALAITKAGNGTGTVTSNETPTPGINCGTDCAEIYLAGTAVTITATPALNSTFNGWSGGGCSLTAPCNLTMNQSRNVTATFQLNTLTIAKTGTGTGTVTAPSINCDVANTDCSETYNVGTMITITATPTSDSLFMGFTGGGCTTSPCMTTINQAQTVTANFVLNTFALNLTKGGAGTGTVTSSPAGIDCNAGCTNDTASFTANTLVTLVPSASADSTFTGFTGACTGMTCAVTMNAVKNVTASFALKPVTLTVSTTSGGKVTSADTFIDCGNTCTHDYPVGTMVSLTPAANNNRAFTGWGGACTGTTVPCVVTMDAAKSVSATFEVNRLTIIRAGNGSGTVTSNPGGINCGGDCSNDYNDNTPVTLTAAASGGSLFTGWTGGPCDGSTSTTCDVTMEGPLEITATFQDASALTVTPPGASGSVTSDVGGINCPGTCAASFVTSAATPVSLTAAANAGFAFVSWSGCDSVAGNVCNVTMNADKTVTPAYAPLFTLTVSTLGGAGSVTSDVGAISCPGTCSDDYVSGTTVTLTGTAGVDWSGGCNTCTDGMPCVVNMAAAVSCTATFP